MLFLLYNMTKKRVKYFFEKKRRNFIVRIKKSITFALAFRIEKMSSGVMVALQILVLPVKVRILARQHHQMIRKACYGM